MQQTERQSPSKPRTMPAAGGRTKIRIVEEEGAAGEAALVFQQFREQFGRSSVPGILKCFATNPAFARHMVGVASSLLFNEGCLTRRRKELIATYISRLNDCPYCTDSHGHYLASHGCAMETVRHIAAGNLEAAAISEEERRLLEYLRKVNSESFRTTQEDVAALRGMGWTNEEIAESVHVAAVIGMSNRVANAFGLPSQDLLGTR